MEFHHAEAAASDHLHVADIAHEHAFSQYGGNEYESVSGPLCAQEGENMTPREILTVILLVLLIICAISVNIITDLLQSVITFMAYSFIMAVVWILMESPDLGITEAAVGAGVSGILFLMTLKKIRKEDEHDPADEIEERKPENLAKAPGGEKDG
jgi:uncharacterized MnhB-related membrane protein